MSDTYSFVRDWGSSGTGAAQFVNPYGVAVDLLGNVYVADHSNGRIQKFDSNGNFLQQTAAGALIGLPWGVTVGPDGNVYVSDYYGDASGTDPNGYLLQLNTDLQVLNSWSGFNRASGVAVDSSGIAYVLEHDNNRVRRLDTTTGLFLSAWAGDGEFSNAFGLAIDPTGQYLYITETFDHDVLRFNKDGSGIGVWATLGAGSEYVTVDSSGNVFVALEDNHILKYSSAGNLLAEWGSSGTGDGEFNRPMGIGISPLNADVYVADQFNSRIQEFTLIPEPAAAWVVIVVGSLAVWWRQKRSR